MNAKIWFAFAALVFVPPQLAFAQAKAASDAPKESATMPDAMDQSHQTMVKKVHKTKTHTAKQKL